MDNNSLALPLSSTSEKRIFVIFGVIIPTRVVQSVRNTMETFVDSEVLPNMYSIKSRMPIFLSGKGL